MADVRWFPEVDSTNRVAAGMAAPGLVVVADYQSAGRGRFDRRWEAPPGSSLLVSLVLPATRPLPGFGVALAAAGACEEVTGVVVTLKWPNDLLAGERKLGGVLGETVGGNHVVGLGLNVNWGPRRPPDGGVALDELVGRPVDRLALLAALLRRVDSPPPEADLLGAYRRRCVTLGQVVRVELGGEVVEARAVDVSPDGHLQLEGGWAVASGDVRHVRPGGGTKIAAVANRRRTSMQAMAVPIKPGKVVTWKSWVGELTGARKAEFDDLNARMGLTLHAAWLQDNPDGSSLAVVVLDGPGAADFLGKLATSDHATDTWFRAMVEDIHPMDFSAPPPPAPQRLV